MTEIISRFVSENIDLIDDNKWEEAYEALLTINKPRIIAPEIIGEFTIMLFNCNIHPETFVRILPMYFLAEADIDEIMLPDNIEEIGWGAFKNCKTLTQVNLPKRLKTIHAAAFSSCSNLTHIDIPETVTQIGPEAFRGSNLKEITLSTNLKEIEYEAFGSLGDNFKIIFKGTKAEWKAKYDSSVFQHTYFTCECTDGKVVKKKRQ